MASNEPLRPGDFPEQKKLRGLYKHVKISVRTSQSLTYGEVIEEPSSPTREGYTFGGWYSDDALNDPWDFDTQIAGDTELYAKWIPNS